MPFTLTGQCQKAFKEIKRSSNERPILICPGPNNSHTLFSDTSKYVWSAVLTQEYTTVIDGKMISHQPPITYVSGLFQGSQLNWALLTREAYVIHMSVKKLSLYLADASITLRTDHLPLKTCLQKTTLNV